MSGIGMPPSQDILQRAGASLLSMTGLVLALYIAALAVLAYLAAANPVLPGEVAATQWVQSWRTPALDSVMKAVAALGSFKAGTAVVLAAAALMLWRGLRSEAIVVVAGSVAGQLVLVALKEAVARPRPSPELVQVLQAADGYSFPSNHTMLFTVLLGLLLVTLLSKVRPGAWRAIVRAAVVLTLMVTGFARVYLGVHWLWDVVAGYAFGAPLAAAAVWSWRWWQGRSMRAGAVSRVRKSTL